MRHLTFVLVGAVFFGGATFFYGLILFPNGLDWLTKQQFALGLVIFGATAGALIGFVAAWVSEPSVTRRTRFLVVGAVVGLLIGLVYGLNVDEVGVIGEMEPINRGYPFLWWVFTPMVSVAAWILAGGVVGGILGLATARLARGGQSSLPAGAESP